MKKLTFGFTGYSDFFIRFSKKLGQSLYISCAVIGAAAVGITSSSILSIISSGILYSSDILYVVIFLEGLIAMIIGGIGIHADTNNLHVKNEELKNENSNLTNLEKKINKMTYDSRDLKSERCELHKKMARIWLRGIHRQLGLDTHERITIHYFSKDHFYILARYSNIPKHAKIHKDKFPHDKGIVSKAWDNKVWIDVEGCPPYDINNPDQYEKYMCEKYSYTPEEIKRRDMNSCRYVAITIADAGDNIGVIVFESDNCDKLNLEKAAKIKKYCTLDQSYMVKFINNGIKYDTSLEHPTNPLCSVEQEFLSIYEENNKNRNNKRPCQNSRKTEKTMASLHDIADYFNCSYKNELSKFQLTGLVYLADWFSVLIDDKKITSIDWTFNCYGPRSDDIYKLSNKNDGCSITLKETLCDQGKSAVSCPGNKDKLKLSEKEKSILDEIINMTKKMDPKEFIRYVYLTYPVSSHERYTHFDLVDLARQYKKSSMKNNGRKIT